MLHRTVCCRRDPRRTFLRALSSSSSNWKGIAVGGIPNASTSAPTTARASFAALRAQVQSTPPNESVKAKSASEFDTPVQVPTKRESQFQTDTSTPSPRTTFSRHNVLESPTSSLRSSFAALRNQVQPSGPSIPFESSKTSRSNRWPVQPTANSDEEVNSETDLKRQLQNRDQAEEAGHDGWGPGLRKKIEGAQLEEQRAVQSRQDSSERDDKEDYMPFNRKLWQPFFKPFANSKAEQCTVPEFRNWMFFSKKHEGTNTPIYQLGLKVRFKKMATAMQAMTSISTNVVNSHSILRHLSYTWEEDQKRVNVQIEIGKRSIDLDEMSTHPLNMYPGIDRHVAGIASRINSIVQLYLDLDEQANRSAIQLKAKKRESSEKDVKEAVRPAKHEASQAPAEQRRPLLRASQFEKRQEAQGDAAVGRGEISQTRLDSIVSTLADGETAQSRDVRPVNLEIPEAPAKQSRPLLRASHSEKRREAQGDSVVGRGENSQARLDSIISTLADGESAQSRAVRRSKAEEPKEKSRNTEKRELGRSSSNDAIEERTPIPSLSDKITVENNKQSRYSSQGPSNESSVSNMGGRFDGTADLFGEDTIEEHTPVPTLSDQSIEAKESSSSEPVAEKVIKSSDSSRVDSPAASTSHVDEATPVLIDDEQAEGTSTISGSEHSFKAAKEQEVGSEIAEESSAEAISHTNGQSSSQDSSNAVDEATPVFVDEEQAKGATSTIADDQQEHSATSIGQIKEQSTASSHDSSNAVDEATPVNVDGEQAKGATSTTASDQHQHSATTIGEIVEQSSAPKEEPMNSSPQDSKSSSIKEGMSGHSDESVEKNVGAYFDGNNSDAYSSSTTHDVNESTPVSIDGEQAKATAITSGSDHSKEMAQKRQGQTEAAEKGEKPSSTIGSIVDGSASQSRSSSNDVNDSVPVAIDGEQVGKKQ